MHAHPGSGSGFDVLCALKTFRPTSLSTSEPQKRRVSSGTARMDPLACIYRTAMDVLTILRELEESAHVSLSDDAYDASSDHSSQSRVALSLYIPPAPTSLK
ncbi:hypothetical protein V8E52_004655, partial [Russula decolorans]